MIDITDQQRGCCYCGVPESLFGRRAALRKWEKRRLLWMIVDWIPTIDADVQSQTYRDAFAQWSAVCGLTFQETTIQAEADFLILTRNIDGSGGTLAEHQLPYGNDEQLRGWFDVGDKWDASEPIGPSQISLLAVATHEFGHGIGLPHIRTPGNLMNPFYDPAIRSPQADDIQQARLRYGPPIAQPAPTLEADYPVKVTIEMSSGAKYPVLVPANGKWGT